MSMADWAANYDASHPEWMLSRRKPMWEAYGPSKIPMDFDHESSVGPTKINDVGGPLCVVSGDTDEESLANARRIADLLNKHGLQEPND